MPSPAHVTSLEALGDFRSALIVFLGHAHRSVDEVGDEIRRMRGRLQNEWRTKWEQELRKSRRQLAQAEQDLLSARLSNLRDNISAQQNAVRKAREACVHAEGKIRIVKIWTREFDNTVDPLVKRIDSLRQVLDHDLPKGLAFIVQAQKTLEDYAGSAPRPPVAPPPASEPTTP